jgi:hypothetical protein
MAMRAMLVLILAVAVSACSSVGPSQRSRPVDPSVPPPEPAPRTGRTTAVQPEAPVPVPRPERERVEPVDLDRLGGVTESTVVATIGAPDSVREQPPGKVWIYSHGACRVEVYLYPSVDVGNMAVLGTAIVPNSLADAERERCRRDLARRTAKAQ